MVVVVMGLQDNTQLELLDLSGRNRWLCHSWINHSRCCREAIHKQKDIVVPQHG